MRVLTNSQIRTYRRCPRAHYHAYEQGYRAHDKSEALRFGEVFHGALERFFLDGLTPALAWLHAQHLDAFEAIKAETLLVGYAARWEGDEVIAVEREFRMPLVHLDTGYESPIFEIGGKLDAIVRRDGKLWVLEHKTTSEDISSGSRYWQALRLDSQVSTYLEGARAIGFDVVGCIYDVIAKPSIKPLKATVNPRYTKSGHLYANQREADEYPFEYAERLKADILENPNRYYARGDVVRLESERLAANQDLWEYSIEILNAGIDNRWPRNPESCFTWNTPCPYWGVCTGQQELTQLRKVDNIHEELSNEPPKQGDPRESL